MGLFGEVGGWIEEGYKKLTGSSGQSGGGGGGGGGFIPENEAPIPNAEGVTIPGIDGDPSVTVGGYVTPEDQLLTDAQDNAGIISAAGSAILGGGGDATTVSDIPDVITGPFDMTADQLTLQRQLAADIESPQASLANQILRTQSQREMANSAALLGSQRGVTNPALVARELAKLKATSGAELGANAAEAAIREKTAQDTMRLGKQQSLGSMFEQDRQAKIDRERIQSAQNIAQMTGEMAAAESDKDRSSEMWGNLGQGAVALGSAYMMAGSDKNIKKNVKPGDDIAEDFLNSLRAVEFNYKDPQFDGEGTWGGVIAQDVEKGPGNVMVEETPRGKQLNFKKGLSMMMAGLGNINDRLKDLEK